MGISRITTEAVKNRMDIEEVLGDYLSLKKKGQNLWACCPFHGEKTPSFSVSPAKQIYKCFGCGVAGDPIQFVMEIEGIGFQEAIRQLAGKYGIEVEEEENRTPEQEERYKEKESLYIALAFGRDFFVKNLRTEEGRSIGLSYFKERGFTQQIIEKFDLGYAMDSWDGLLTAGKEAGFSEDIMLKAGLILQKESDANRKYDRFRGRVTFTIHNIGGKPIGFGARILTKDKNQPKYINSPETPVYHKSDVLYGMYQAKQSIRNKKNCYLVEGYTDVISMHMSGIENVVASSGTSLTEGQIGLIKRFSDQVTVLYDGDPAGIKASLRGIDLLLESGLNVKAVVFPEGEDPDSYSQKVGSEAFQTYLEENGRNFIGFKIDLYRDEMESDPIKKAELIKEIVQSISKIPDPIWRSVFSKEAANLLDIDEDILFTELNKSVIQNQKQGVKRQEIEREAEEAVQELLEPEKPTPFGDILQIQERELIRLLLNYGGDQMDEEGPSLSNYLLEEVSDVEFHSPVHKKILQVYHEFHERGESPQINYFVQMGDPEVQKEVIDLVTNRHEVSSLWTERFQIFINSESDDLSQTGYKSILRLKRRIIQKMMEEAKEKLKVGENDHLDEQKIQELQEIYFALKKYQLKIDKELGIVIG